MTTRLLLRCLKEQTKAASCTLFRVVPGTLMLVRLDFVVVVVVVHGSSCLDARWCSVFLLSFFFLPALAPHHRSSFALTFSSHFVAFPTHDHPTERSSSHSSSNTMAAATRLVNPSAEIVSKSQALLVNCSAAKGLQNVLKTNLGKWVWDAERDGWVDRLE